MAAEVALDREAALAILYELVRLRRFEERCYELYGARKIRGFLHLYSGEEAVAVGALPCLRPEDAIVSTYREHGHALARGLSARAVMAELFGKAEGCSGGRGGSMHLFDPDRRFYGGHAIVGAGLPFAVGLALADAMRGDRRVTACFFGDGAVAEGEFHEAMNLAALWCLPVLFLCENNLYAMGLAVERCHARPDLADRGAAYGMPSSAVDGMDVLAVRAAVDEAAAAVRGGGGPRFLELRTYRFRGHSMFDPQLYRSREEVRERMERDPIRVFEAAGRARGVLRDGDVEAATARAEAEVDDAVAFAEAGTLEPVETLGRHVYVREVAP